VVAVTAALTFLGAAISRQKIDDLASPLSRLLTVSWFEFPGIKIVPKWGLLWGPEARRAGHSGLETWQQNPTKQNAPLDAVNPVVSMALKAFSGQAADSLLLRARAHRDRLCSDAIHLTRHIDAN
jgi:hypothetical protein